jgi:hypothetical protein
MITGDERDLKLEFFYDNLGSRIKPSRNPNCIQAFLEMYRQIKDSLQLDLIEHHW